MEPDDQDLAAFFGTVTGRDGVPLPGVTVSATDGARQWESQTSDTPPGEYEVVGLPPGAYTLTFRVGGDTTIAHRQIAGGERIKVDVVLGDVRYHQETIRSWSDYRQWTQGPLRNWTFRGQADAAWPLWSTLSRTLGGAGVHPDLWTEQEDRILRVFKRKAHLFLDHLPHDRDEFQWLALMQHHGAPTRLLDLTWSPEVAAFFALERATTPAAVWCFHHHTINQAVLGFEINGRTASRNGVSVPFTPQMLAPKCWPSDPHSLERAQANYEEYFLNGDLGFVYLGEPHIMNQRLTAQNATFAVPSLIDKPVDEIINAHAEMQPGLVKLVLLPELRRDAMRSLYAANVTNATLFPGLDGLARSMAFELEYHWKFDLHTKRRLAGFDDPRAGWDAR